MTAEELKVLYPDHSWTFEYPRFATRCNLCDTNLQRDECLADITGCSVYVWIVLIYTMMKQI
jgi:hypothetical protein